MSYASTAEPVREHRAQKQHSIREITREENSLLLTWDDGRASRFHYIWLRDNCMCSACGDRSGGHRYLELRQLDFDVSPIPHNVNNNGDVTLTWTGDNHTTTYSANWLRANCYTPDALHERQQMPMLWDSSLNNRFPRWSFVNISENEPVRLEMFKHIHDYGFAFLDKVPVDTNAIQDITRLFGFIRQTHYGRIFDLISKPQKRILAETSHAIRPHNDELFRDPTPGLLIMHCLQPSDCGGGASVLTDGFHAATKLRAHDKEAFDLLCNTPITHRRFLVDNVDDVALQATWRTIELDHYNNIKAFRFNERTMAPFDAPESLIELIYRAMQKLSSILYSDSASITHRLEAGEAVIFDNHRVLHARESFNGARHIRQCHVDRDEFFSRLRSMQRRLPPHET